MAKDKIQAGQALPENATGQTKPVETVEGTIDNKDVHQELEQVLESLAPEQRASVTRVIHAIRQESFSGPIPHPELLKGYESIQTGFAERIVRMAEKEQDHRFDQDEGQLECSKMVISGASSDSKRGQWLAFVVAVLFLSGSVFLAFNGHDTVASILGGGTLLGIVTAFIAGGKNKKDKE